MDFSKVKEWQIPEGKVASVSVGGVVIWQAKTQAEQLTAPTISLDGSTLTMTATDDKTQEFVIFVDEVETTTTSDTTFDLSTLNLSAGTHTITVKARASGYADSPASNSVSYVVESNTVQVSGTWYFDETIDDSNDYFEYVSFVSNGVRYNEIYADLDTSALMQYRGDGLNDTVYYGGAWEDEAYRTITFDGVQTVSKEFYEWLVANAKRPISGTWKWVNPYDFADVGYAMHAEFISNGSAFDGIIGWGKSITYNQTTIYRTGSGWVNENYQYITFSGTQYLDYFEYIDFTDCFVFAFTIDGTTYYAKEGMTWGEWVESEYNTGGVTQGGAGPDGSYYIQYGGKNLYKYGVLILTSDIITNIEYSTTKSPEPA